MHLKIQNWLSGKLQLTYLSELEFLKSEVFCLRYDLQEVLWLLGRLERQVKVGTIVQVKLTPGVYILHEIYVSRYRFPL